MKFTTKVAIFTTLVALFTTSLTTQASGFFGSGAGGGGGSPGGTSGQVQYNNAGSFGGFGSWNGTTLAIPGAISSTTTMAVGTNLHVFGTSIMAGDMVVQGGANFSGNLGFYGASEIGQPSGNIFTALTNLGLITSPSLALTNLPAQASNTILGNNTGGSATPTALTVAQVDAILPVFTSTLNGLVPLSGGGTANFLRADGTFAAPAGTAGITALTGDGTASGPGSAALTLATVNSNVGSFGSSTSIPSFTVNAKGLVTAASGNAVIAPAGTLTGTTLASNVVSSSLTSLGTITTGIWNGTTIAIANGGTGQTSKAPAFDALSPMTTGGDLIYGGASGTGTRLANGSSGQVLTSQGTTVAPIWAAATGGLDSVDDLQNFTLAISFSAGAMTVAIKNKAGNDPSSGDPVKVAFLTSETSGTYVVRTITAATSLVVPSGAQLGGTNGTIQTIYFYLIDNAGTVEIAVVGFRINNDWDKISTTAINTSSDVGNVLYSTTSRSGIMSRTVGYMTSQQTTSGTWAQSPTILFAGPVRNSNNTADQAQTSAITSSTNFPSSNTYGDLTSIVLNPGIWDVSMAMLFVTNSSTTTQALGGLGTVSGNSATGLSAGNTQMDFGVITLNNSNSLPEMRVSVPSVSTYYFKYLAVYSVGTPQARGRISAVRIQ